MSKIIITTQSIKNRLKAYSDKPAESMLEYIWNGFDANASSVHIKYNFKQKIDGVPFGYPDLEIIDDGDGWNVDDVGTTKHFLDSSKKAQEDKSLPQGKDGVGRFTFFSFAEKATWETVWEQKKYRISLETEKLDDYSLEKEDYGISIDCGTKVIFTVASDKITEHFFEFDLKEAIKLEFCWFLKLFPGKSIYINDVKIDIKENIAKEENTKIFVHGHEFTLNLIQWLPKPTHESSKYYFLNEEGQESFNKTTGLNHQSDDFFHSAYTTSSFFDVIQKESDLLEREKDTLPLPQKTGKDKKDVYKDLLEEIRKRLEVMRKPYLKKLSHEKITQWRNEDILPEVKEFGLNQKDYEKIIKEVYVAVPQLFKGNDDQKRLILRLFPALLGSEEKGYILKILDQVYALTAAEKKTLAELLERTTLSHITRMAKEIDDRLHILAVLEKILFDSDVNKYTKEVVHLQKILDENFWIFGEDFRLLASAEGSIRKTLLDFKDTVLRKENSEIKTRSRKELDILLTKVDQTSQKVSCVVVEIKRPSVTLTKKEYDQIYEYMDIVTKEPACNGDKISWKFYLVGLDYDDYIKKQIENVSSRGEKDEGLAFFMEGVNAKLYVKKWSDIINVEQKSRYSFLQEKLNIKKKNIEGEGVDNIVEKVTKKNSYETNRIKISSR